MAQRSASKIPKSTSRGRDETCQGSWVRDSVAAVCCVRIKSMNNEEVYIYMYMHVYIYIYIYMYGNCMSTRSHTWLDLQSSNQKPSSHPW